MSELAVFGLSLSMAWILLNIVRPTGVSWSWPGDKREGSFVRSIELEGEREKGEVGLV